MHTFWIPWMAHVACSRWGRVVDVVDVGREATTVSIAPEDVPEELGRGQRRCCWCSATTCEGHSCRSCSVEYEPRTEQNARKENGSSSKLSFLRRKNLKSSHIADSGHPILGSGVAQSLPAARGPHRQSQRCWGRRRGKQASPGTAQSLRKREPPKLQG